MHVSRIPCWVMVNYFSILQQKEHTSDEGQAEGRAYVQSNDENEEDNRIKKRFSINL